MELVWHWRLCGRPSGDADVVEPGFAPQRHQRCVDFRLGLAHGGEQAGVGGGCCVAVRWAWPVSRWKARKIAKTRRNSGSASPSRLVACSNWARLLRSDRDVRMVLAVAGLVDRQRAAHQRFRLAEPVGVLQQAARLLSAVATRGWSGP